MKILIKLKTKFYTHTGNIKLYIIFLFYESVFDKLFSKKYHESKCLDIDKVHIANL